MPQLETVKLAYTKFLDKNKEFHESFLQFCTSLKRLCISSKTTPIIGIDNSWLQRKYPKLENVELFTHENHYVNEFQVFFEQNVNLKHLMT